MSKMARTISIYLFLVWIPCSASLSFDFPKILPKDQNTEIVPEGDGAYISDGGIQVTPDGIGSDRSQKAGRAKYIKPLHIWDKASRQLAAFTTNFSFVIDSDSPTQFADGLTFFLAQENSVITAGGAMGLPVSSSSFVMVKPFVSVEFDTFFNYQWDPTDINADYIGNHVGINVNSLTSVRYQKWYNNVTGGRECRAWINYDSVLKNLSVSFTGYENGTELLHYGLDYIIDLRDVLPERVIFGFSAATGALFQKNNVKSWSFSSSDLNPISPPTISPIPSKGKNSSDSPVVANNRMPSSTSPTTTKRKGRKPYVAGLIAALCVLVTVLALLSFLVQRKKKKKKKKETRGDEHGPINKPTIEIQLGPWAKNFSFDELDLATNGFREKVAEGGFGAVYKGFFKDSGTRVAVKRVSKSLEQGIKEYAAEVNVINKLRHKNLVPLIGWCHEKEELILVYEYMEEGSLDSHLFNAKNLLPWGRRYEIAKGLASALLYLQEGCVQCVVHRDIKSSNVLLDKDFNARLGDFGLAKLVDHEKGWQKTYAAGTVGYMAPEYVGTGRISKESDVYSFGVVALEIACGRKIVDNKAQEHQKNLVEWVWGLYGTDKILEAADPHLGSNFVKKEMERLMIVGLSCANPNLKGRPTVQEAIKALKFEAELPRDLPKTMPVATYCPAPTFSSDVDSVSQGQSSSSNHNTDSSMQTASSTASSSSPSVPLINEKR